MKYFIERPDLDDDEQETIIRVEDGGVVSLHHNGEHMLTEYYQDRCTNPEVDWDKLAEGKAYIKDWEGHDLLTQEMIQDALDWLVMGEEDWSEVSSVEELNF